MSSRLSLIAALALAAGILGPGAASAASCRDAQGHFAKCPAAAPAKERCHDAKGKFVKCSASKSAPAASTTSVKK
jgi:hypothetical protein